MRYTNLGELMLMEGWDPSEVKRKSWKTWVLEDQTTLGLYLVPALFCTDFASIPAPLRPIFRSNGAPWQRAAVLHDYLYACISTVSRKRADRNYYWQARRDGTPEWKAAVMYAGLRVGAAMAFRKNRKRLKEEGYAWRLLDRGNIGSPLWNGRSG